MRHVMVTLFGLLPLAACAVGPDFERPAPPEQTAYDVADIPDREKTTTPDLYLSYGETIPEQWWHLFKCDALDQTLRMAIAENQTLAAARATLAQARDSVEVARAAFFPQIGVGATVERNGSGAFQPTGSGFSSNSYSIGPTVSYTFDLFGATRRTVEQDQALAEYQKDQLGAAYLTLTGGAVTDSIAIAAARLQIDTVDALIDSDNQNLAMVRREFDMGKAARGDVLTAESQLLGDRAQLSSLRQQLSVARHALAVLLSRSPASWMPPEFDIKDFALPTDLPATVPSDLVRQRPDIMAAEAQLHAASAAIGVATAQMFPSLTLSGAVTQESSTFNKLFSGSSNLWSIGANLAQPIYEGGALEAQKREAVDAYAAQLASYRQTVIAALGQVADVLRALDHDVEFLANARRSLDVARASLDLQRESYKAGKASLLQLIVAERTYAQSRLSFATAQIQQLQDAAQLFVALGGGWWRSAAATDAAPP
jgi:NodT family efflux transporter outer membrane factor (OMF) lipoprotein